MVTATLPGGGEENPFLPFSSWRGVQYCLLCMYSMGLPALCTMSYSVYRFSGLFLVGYAFMFALIVSPIAWLQLRLGQLYRRGLAATVSHFTPILKGAGFLALLYLFINCISHNVLMAQCLHYMFVCMTGSYPWVVDKNQTKVFTYRTTHDEQSHVIFRGRTPAEHYYYNHVLHVYAPGMTWTVALTLLLACVLTALPLVRGARSLAKVVYVTVPPSIILLVTLAIYANLTSSADPHPLTLLYRGKQGDSNHDNHQTDTDAPVVGTALSSPKMWLDSLEMLMSSLGLWMGALPTLGAHLGNPRRMGKFALLPMIAFLFLTPVLITMVTGPFLQSSRDRAILERSVHPGATLLFVTLPDAFSNLGTSCIWVVLFYLCVVLMALHHQVFLILTLMENIVECLPRHWLRHFRRQETLPFILCILLYILGLPQICHVGHNILQMLDQYLCRYLSSLVPLLVPALVSAYVKLNSLHLPIEKICLLGWFVAACVGIIAIEIYKDFTFTRPLLKVISWPTWLHAIGHVVSRATPLVCLILGAAHALYTAEGSFTQRLKSACRLPCEDLRDQPGCYRKKDQDVDADDNEYAPYQPRFAPPSKLKYAVSADSQDQGDIDHADRVAAASKLKSVSSQNHRDTDRVTAASKLKSESSQDHRDTDSLAAPSKLKSVSADSHYHGDPDMLAAPTADQEDLKTSSLETPGGKIDFV